MNIENSDNKGNEGRVNWKRLVLMTPEGAIKWTIYTEAPVLISPTLNRSLKCGGCRHPYRPLVYRPGVCDDVRCSRLLKDGILLPSYKPDFLIPLCEDHGLFEARAVLKFRVAENGLVFSPLQPPPK